MFIEMKGYDSASEQKESPRKLTQEEAKKRISQHHQNIELISTYVDYHQPVSLHCKICDHIWKITYASALRNGACPVCSKKEKSEQANQDFIKRVGKMNPQIEVLGTYTSAKSNIKAKCKICGCVWNPKAETLIYRKTHCPDCSNRSRSHKHMKYTHASFVAKLHEISPTIEITGQFVNTYTKITARCSVCGYEWENEPIKLLKGQGCRRCAMKNRRISEDTFVERLYKKWPDLEYVKGYTGISGKVCVRCKKCGHEWVIGAKYLLETRCTGCPSCFAPIRQTERSTPRITNQEFLKRVHAIDETIIPLEPFKGSRSRIKVRCSICNTVWSPVAETIMSGRHGCPKCAKLKAATKRLGIKKEEGSVITADQIQEKENELFAQKLADTVPEIKLVGNYQGSHTKTQFHCTQCGHDFVAYPYNILRRKRCPNCTKGTNTSFPEQIVYYYVSTYFPDAINGYCKEMKQQELDVFIPSKNVGIEYDGFRYHSSTDAKRREKNKYLTCQERGIHLIRICDNNNIEKREACDQMFCTDGRIHHGTYNLMTPAVTNLLKYLGVKKPDVNIKRDYDKIVQLAYKDYPQQHSLAKYNPEAIAEWDYEKNGGITPDQISSWSSQKYWWKCSEGHSWSTSPMCRSMGCGCPRCNRRRSGRKKKDVVLIHA